jgi:hypothetical protein
MFKQLNHHINSHELNNTHSNNSVYDILEKYYYGNYILYKIPNWSYSSYYILSDPFKGIVSSNLIDFANNINQFTHEDILAMKIHPSYYKTYRIENEKDLAKHLLELFIYH